jgi:2Fe-2S ferredoxin
MPNVTFISKDGTKQTIDAEEGSSVLEIAKVHDVDLEGACNGALACATCHVVVDEESYEKLSKPTEVEEELIEFAYGAAPTSRLSCQVRVTKELDGIKIKIPE